MSLNAPTARSFRRVVAAAALVLSLCVAAPAASAATVQQVTAFGSNPTGIGMYLYTPSNVVAHPPILVGVHACHGKGTDVCAPGSPFAAQADKFGFLLICPSAVSSDGCWDVHSNADLTHNNGGDAAGIISMVNYVIQNKNGDATKVYVAGHSSGGMMTNVLAGSYPDIFKAGAAFAGVPFACFAQGSVDSLGWNASCANGNVSMTGMQWGNLVRGAYPGYAGARPRMQLWHGTTDATVSFKNFAEEIEEWTNVLGVSETPTSTETNAIQSGWIRTRYADPCGGAQVEAIQETGQPHNLVVDMADAVKFFGLDGSNPGTCAAGGSGGSTGSGGAGGPRGGAGGSASGGGGSGTGGGLGGSGGLPSGAGGRGAGAGGTTAGASGAGLVTGGGGAAGGTVATGGLSQTGTGGAAATGGSQASGGGSGGTNSAAGPGDNSGCSCRTSPDGQSPFDGHRGAWLMVAAAILARRVRRRPTIRNVVPKGR